MSLRHNRRRRCSNTTIAYCSFNLRYIDKMHIGRLSLRSAAACCHMATKLLHGAAEEITSGLGLKFSWKFVSRTVAADKQNSRQLCKQNVSVLLPASMRLFHLISARSNILLPGSVLATLLPTGLNTIVWNKKTFKLHRAFISSKLWSSGQYNARATEAGNYFQRPRSFRQGWTREELKRFTISLLWKYSLKLRKKSLFTGNAS